MSYIIQIMKAMIQQMIKPVTVFTAAVLLFGGFMQLFGADIPQRYADSFFHDQNNGVGKICLTSGSELDASDYENPSAIIFKGRQESEVYLLQQPTFLTNGTNGIIYNISTNGNDVNIEFKVKLNNSAVAERLACRFLMDQELRGKFNGDRVDFKKLPAKYITVEVNGRDKNYTCLTKPVDISNRDDWNMVLGIPQEDFDSFKADLDANNLSFEFQLHVDKVLEDSIELDSHIMLDIVNALKSVLGSEKNVFILDQGSYQALKNFIRCNVKENITVSHPEYLAIIGRVEVDVQSLISLCFEKLDYNPNQKYAEKEWIKMAQVSTSVNTKEQADAKVKNKKTEDGTTTVESQKGDAALEIGPFSAGGGTSEQTTTFHGTTESDFQNHMTKEGEVSENTKDHAIQRFAIREGIDGVEAQYEKNIKVKIAIAPDYITKVSYPGNTYDKVKTWYSSYDQEIQEYLDKFQSDLSKPAQTANEIQDVNVQIETLVEVFRINADMIKDILSKAGNNSDVYKNCDTLLKNGLWMSLGLIDPEKQAGIAKDTNNMAAYFEAMLAGLSSLKMDRLDSVNKRKLFDIKEIHFVEHNLATVREAAEYHRDLNDLHFALSEKLESRQKVLDDLTALNDELIKFIGDNQ